MAATVSEELRREIAKAGGAPIELVDPESNEAFVLLKSDQYERIKALFQDDPMSREEQLYFLREAGKRAGWDDPAMDVYNDLDPRRERRVAGAGRTSERAR